MLTSEQKKSKSHKKDKKDKKDQKAKREKKEKKERDKKEKGAEVRKEKAKNPIVNLLDESILRTKSNLLAEVAFPPFLFVLILLLMRTDPLLD